jgi:hypothetical protein
MKNLRNGMSMRVKLTWPARDDASENSARLDTASPPHYAFVAAAMGKPNLAKPFAIAGFVLGEIYMFFAVVAPYHTGAPIPGGALAWKVVLSALFFGPFGALVGTGVGLLVSALLPKK